MFTLTLALLLGQMSPPEPSQAWWPTSPDLHKKTVSDPHPRWSRTDGRYTRSGADDYAFFEFAPASGAGLGAPCACAAVTGAKGETVTWTRGSSAMCTKSASETSIANGDLVLCGNNLPRVMSLGGPLGVLVESSRTNDNLWSDDLSNAAYTSPLSGVAAVTVTAAFATGPTGATNATRLQFPATTGVQYSLRAQVAGAAAARTGSIYVKGTSASGTIDLVWGGVGAQCAACAFNSTTWTRCSFPTASAVNTWEFGNDSADCASAARGAIDVLVAGVQSEIGAYATSYIPTTTVAVTRSAETGSVAIPTGTVAQCMGATLNLPALVSVSFPRYLSLRQTPSNYLDLYANGSAPSPSIDAVVGGVANNLATAPPTLTAGLGRASWGATNATQWTRCFDNSCDVGTVTSTSTITAGAADTTLWIGSYYNGTLQADGVVSQVKLDNTSSTRCR